MNANNNLNIHNIRPLQELNHVNELMNVINELEDDLLKQGANRVLTPGEASIKLNNQTPDHRIELDFMMAASFVNTLQAAKNVHYDNSYSKRGLLSIFFNVERKWLRIDKQLFSDTMDDAGSETFMDTLGDFAAYAMKMFAWYAVRNPVAYYKWLEMVRKECQAVGLMPPVVEPPLTHPCGCPLQGQCLGHEETGSKEDKDDN